MKGKGWKYDKGSKIYKDAYKGKKVDPKDIKNQVDFMSAVAGILKIK